MLDGVPQHMETSGLEICIFPTFFFTHSYVFVIFISYLRRVPVEGKSSVCMICMKYRITILIIIIIRLGKILLYIANTSRTHACACTHVHACGSTHTHTTVSAIQVSAIRWHSTVTAHSTGIHSR